MHLKNLWLYQFKNHQQQSFDFIDGINAIYGKNGVGKTNILDSIYYLCNGKSYFTNTDSKVVSIGADELSVRGIFSFDNNAEDDVLIKFNSQKKKIIQKNQKTYKRLIDHVGNFPVVMVTPTDIALIYDGSEERRRFMDLVLCQTNKNYMLALQQYKKILEARNAVLKNMYDKNIKDFTLLEGYNIKILPNALFIAEERKKFITIFAPIFSEIYQKIAQQKDNISFMYETNSPFFEQHINEQMEKDYYAGRTTKGVHKDDLLFLLDDEPIKKFASQGQIKSFLIALKIAQFDYIKIITNKKPILLLDDIFEKIDEDRAQALINLVSELHFGQIFISDTHKSRLEKHIFGLNTSINIIPL